MTKYVITGGPCTGKTTIINALAADGYQILPETARQLIAEEQTKKNGILPWTDVEKFQKTLWQRQLQLERNAKEDRHVFLDRGLVDILAFANDFNITLHDTALSELQAANYKKVFVLDRLPHYQTDDQRKETPEQSKRIHDFIEKKYNILGYTTITIPPVSVEKRKELIIQHLHDDTANKEIEGKFKADSLLLIETRLEKYLMTRHAYQEKNTMHDVDGIFEQMGLSLRLRDADKKIITVKSQSSSQDIGNRVEFESTLTEQQYHTLYSLLQQTTSYEKIRTTYTPFGDKDVTICLDDVLHLGKFVEIEAPSAYHIDLWKNRLGIDTDHISTPYHKMIN